MSETNFNKGLQTYLRSRAPIRPLKSLFRDSTVWWAITGAVASSFMLPSGAQDELKHFFAGENNYFRQIQGAGAVSNLTLALIMVLIGRAQTYRDLRDFQAGVDPSQIMARADMTQKGFLSRAFSKAADRTHNIISYVSLFLCGVMMLSGIASGRYGEALSAVLLVPSYLVRLMPETYGTNDPTNKIPQYVRKQFMGAMQSPMARKYMPGLAAKLVKTIINQPPLALSAFLGIWRLFPSLGNAIIEKDPYQITQYSVAILMLAFLSNSTKDAIGRYQGSIIDQNRPNGLPITKVLLEGRFPSLRSLFKPPQPPERSRTTKFVTSGWLLVVGKENFLLNTNY
ncbi:MAG: hypothetical protein L6Q57_06380 [Alphaproteobacteria bacterium]|nr:hypothetical protein [Alphaproteobacteria bacterium]